MTVSPLTWNRVSDDQSSHMTTRDEVESFTANEIGWTNYRNSYGQKYVKKHHKYWADC